jgi:hypothetical protein
MVLAASKRDERRERVAIRVATMDLRAQVQRSAVADEVSALAAVLRPILVGLLLGLKEDVVAEAGGREEVKLKMLPRLRRPGDGDLGICFEYAVHGAVRDGNPRVLERVEHALTLCNLGGSDIRSILFAVEKMGSEQLINTGHELITDDSRLMSGTRGQPVKLQRHIKGIAQAFRRPTAREALPYSISGAWKADLFLGVLDEDRWVATTVKSNPRGLEPGRGLRIGIVPASEAETDMPFKDDQRNMVVCPLLHDGNFMQVFYEGWQVAQAFLAADAHLPSEAALPRPPMRQMARVLEDAREFPVLAVVDQTLPPLAQPELLDTEQETAEVELTNDVAPEMQTVIAPEPRQTGEQ